MGTITKKALEEARAAVVSEHGPEIEARATLSVVEEQRVALALERDEAIEAAHDKHDSKVKELDLELANAIAGVRGIMAAKVIASKLGVSVNRQRELLDLLENSSSTGTDDASDAVESTTTEPVPND
ncbi:hypothetical protein [Corynebacterium variabile]|uniref:hypothetical protein n=1 Tax=Corynebacterium variabile TaxID=1727 RepID=UPI003BAE5A27